MAVLAFNMALLCSVPIVAKSVNGGRRGVWRPPPHCMAQYGQARTGKVGVAEDASPPRWVVAAAGGDRLGLTTAAIVGARAVPCYSVGGCVRGGFTFGHSGGTSGRAK